jgi:hypothetical protein
MKEKVRLVFITIRVRGLTNIVLYPLVIMWEKRKRKKEQHNICHYMRGGMEKGDRSNTNND